MIPGRTRVLIVAERDVVAAALEAALRDNAEAHVALGGPGALDHLIAEHDPTVVVLATTTARAASALEANIGVGRVPPVVLVVDDPRGAWTAAARRAGVHSVLGCDAPAEQIRAAVGAASAGLITLHPDVFRAIARPSVGEVREERPLTAREREILEMLAGGLSNRMIGRRLGISMYTVKFHVASILGKLHASGRVEAVTVGVRRGLISL